jgi:hypothetical protein
VLIQCKALSDDEFCLEVFEASVIEAELALQSTIGDTATVAEQRNDLIDDLVKVHAFPSPCVSLQGMSQCCGSAYQNRGLISITIGRHAGDVWKRFAMCLHTCSPASHSLRPGSISAAPWMRHRPSWCLSLPSC